jgi:inosose dehydratase
MTVRAANAPTSWGIEPPDRVHDPPWPHVLDEIAEAGYPGIELGPFGYLPSSPAQLTAALGERRLALAAGYVMTPLEAAGGGDDLDAVVRKTCELLSACGSGNLILIDAVDRERTATAGRTDDARRLDQAGWRRLTDCVLRVAAIAGGEFSLRVSLHPHVGTHVEFEDEVERVLADVEPAVLGLCPDTGHLTYAGMDPLAVIARHADRLAYVHLKDIDDERLARARAERQSFDAAVGAGIFRPLGQGCVDFASLREALDRLAYTGWVTVEQDRMPDSSSTPLQEARASLAFLARIGLV